MPGWGGAPRRGRTPRGAGGRWLDRAAAPHLHRLRDGPQGRIDCPETLSGADFRLIARTSFADASRPAVSPYPADPHATPSSHRGNASRAFKPQRLPIKSAGKSKELRVGTPDSRQLPLHVLPALRARSQLDQSLLERDRLALRQSLPELVEPPAGRPAGYTDRPPSCSVCCFCRRLLLPGPEFHGSAIANVSTSRGAPAAPRQCTPRASRRPDVLAVVRRRLTIVRASCERFPEDSGLARRARYCRGAHRPHPSGVRARPPRGAVGVPRRAYRARAARTPPLPEACLRRSAPPPGAAAGAERQGHDARILRRRSGDDAPALPALPCSPHRRGASSRWMSSSRTRSR